MPLPTSVRQPIRSLALVCLLFTGSKAWAQQLIPVNAKRPPVILMNGWQLFGLGCLNATGVTGTFGPNLEKGLLADGVPAVFPFDVCTQGATSKIEDLAANLAKLIGHIKYADGRAIDRVDLVAHSMGGLIARAYLAGLQSNGTFSPPIEPKVRKLVQVATPNFGSFLAVPNVDPQTTEMIPGSAFLWSLATWNQRVDDLRGVDAIAIVGNLGRKAPSGSSDGVVSLTSAALTFAFEPNRTRVLPYCHADLSVLEQTLLACPGSGIAKAPETESIIRTFLADNESWQSIGTAAPRDPVLSRYAGVFFEAFNANNQPFGDITGVNFGAVALKQNGTIFNQDMISGSGAFQATSTSLGTFNCGTAAPAVGYFSMFRCKASPVITGVSPRLANTAARLVKAGAPVTVQGAGFGSSQCSNCSIKAGAMTLAVTAWSDQAISFELPAAVYGFTTLTVQNAAGVDSINIMAAAPPDVPPELTVSPIAMQFTDDQPQAVSISNTGGGGALSWTAQKSAAWIVLSSSSGVTPSSVNVSVDTAQNPGTYSGTVTISASGVTQAIAITLTILPPKTNGTTITSVVNAASLLPGPIAPGEIILITGTNLKRPVSISGVPATVLYDSPTQIVAIAPSQFALTINTIAISSVSVPIQSARANPGIFNLAGQAIAKNADGTWNSSLQPAAVGTNVTIFITGAGGFTDAVSAIVGGVSAMVVAAGPAPAPYASGVGQIKLRVPVVLTSGSVPVQVQIGTAMSPGTPSIFVQ